MQKSYFIHFIGPCTILIPPRNPTTFLVNDCAQENHNIFSRLNPDEYRQVLGNMKHCILATDLALFFPNKARLADAVERGEFSWAKAEDR